MALTLAGAGAVIGGLEQPAFAGTLASPAWSVSNSAPGHASTSYTYTFATATASTLNSVTMTVPAGTSGTPAVGTVTPSSVATGGSISLASNTLTYTFTSASISSGTAVSIQITGLTNTSTPGSYTSVISTLNGTSLVDSGTSPAVIIGGSLVQPLWFVSNTAVSATGVTYSYSFTTATNATLSKFTMTVPAGTAGTPALGSVTPSAVGGGSLSAGSNTLTYSFTPVPVSSGTAVTIQITGLTNTATTGSYTSVISTFNGSALVDGGTTSAVSFPGTLALTAPGSLAWNATQGGTDQSIVDTGPADQQLSVNDSTGDASGWHVTVSATTFISGTKTLPDTGRVDFTGSISSLSSAAPSSGCTGSCFLPADTTTYPVPISTAASSPAAFTIYDTSAGTGVGAITIGGHSASHPIGWWVQVPSSAFAGSYASTLTLTLVSGP
jgi:hypothetical protein